MPYQCFLVKSALHSSLMAISRKSLLMNMRRPLNKAASQVKLNQFGLLGPATMVGEPGSNHCGGGVHPTPGPNSSWVTVRRGGDFTFSQCCYNYSVHYVLQIQWYYIMCCYNYSVHYLLQIQCYYIMCCYNYSVHYVLLFVSISF